MPLQPIRDGLAPRPSSRPRKANQDEFQEELPFRVLSPSTFLHQGDLPSQPRPSEMMWAPRGDHGSTDEAAAKPWTPDVWPMQRALGEAVKPLAVQVEDNGAAIRQIAEVLSKFGQKLEERMGDERRHMDFRFETHEKLMKFQAEGRLSHLTRHLEAVQAMQRQAMEVATELGERLPKSATTFALGEETSSATVPTPSALEGKLAPLEASLRRIEAALDSRSGGRPKRDAAAAVAPPRSSGAAAALCGAPAACAAALGAAGADAAGSFALEGVWAASRETSRSGEASAALGLAKLQELEYQQVRAIPLAASQVVVSSAPEAGAGYQQGMASAVPSDPGFKAMKPSLKPKFDNKDSHILLVDPLTSGDKEESQARACPEDIDMKLEEARVDLASAVSSPSRVSTPKSREKRSTRMDDEENAESPAPSAPTRESTGTISSLYPCATVLFSRAKSSEEDGLPLSKDSRRILGLDYEEILHYHTTTTGFLQKKISNLLLRLCVYWSQIQEPPRTGCLAQLLRSFYFEGFCALVICVNAGFMAHWTNQRAQLLQDAHAYLTIEVVFLSWYIVEVSLKMFVHRVYFLVGPEMNWNIFDMILVVLALSDFVGSALLSASRSNFSDATLLRSLRVLKMAKILRVMRIMRVFNDLRLMLTSVIGSCISLLWSFLMLAFVYYIFGLIFVQSMTDFLIEGGDDMNADMRRSVLQHFGSLGQAMLTLFKATNGGNDWDYYYSVVEPTGWGNCILFVVFIGFIQISLMNILTAVFVERAMRLAQPDTISQAREQRQKERAEAEELRSMCRQMDRNNSGTVSAQEFHKHIESAAMRCYFSVLGLDIRNAQEFFEMLLFIGEGDEVDIECFVQGCLRMRGVASGIAQQNLIMETRLLRRSQCDIFQQFSKKLDAITERLPT